MKYTVFNFKTHSAGILAVEAEKSPMHVSQLSRTTAKHHLNHLFIASTSYHSRKSYTKYSLEFQLHSYFPGCMGHGLRGQSSFGTQTLVS